MTYRIALLLVLAATLTSRGASAQELERAVVRNRLISVAHRLELSLDAATALEPRLVNTTNLNAGVGFNVSETWGLELRGGYALSGHSSLASSVARRLLLQSPTGTGPESVIVNDLSGLWELKANLVAGVRWAPLYGKVSLLSDNSVHFQAYLWLGGGVAALHRQSVVDCMQGADNLAGTCGSWLEADRTAPLGSAALGARFFIGHLGALKLEIRDYAYRDAYLLDVDRSVAQSGGVTGRNNPSPGLTNLVMFDLGFTFLL